MEFDTESQNLLNRGQQQGLQMQPRVVATSQECFEEKVGTGRQKSCNDLCLLAQGYWDTLHRLVVYSVGKQLKRGRWCPPPTELGGGWPEALLNEKLGFCPVLLSCLFFL